MTPEQKTTIERVEAYIDRADFHRAGTILLSTKDAETLCALARQSAQVADPVMQPTTATMSVAGSPAIKMLVDVDWLREKVKTDPDLDTEAGSPATWPDEAAVERLAEALFNSGASNIGYRGDARMENCRIHARAALLDPFVHAALTRTATK